LFVQGRIKRLPAHLAKNQIQRDHIIPLPDQKMLKFDGLLGAYPPALTAPGAFGHIVLKCSFAVLIAEIQGRSRTIFHTGQTNVTVLIYSKICHDASPGFENNLVNNRYANFK
jgi:hypothetical protein